MKKTAANNSLSRRNNQLSPILISYLLIFLMFHQPLAVVAAATQNNQSHSQEPGQPVQEAAKQASGLQNIVESAKQWLGGVFLEKKETISSNVEAENNSEAALLTNPPANSTVTAAISRHHPSLNGGRIQGDLRVFSGESYNFNRPFQLTGDVFNVGTPNITVNSGASHGGVVNDGGNAQPSGYGITLNSNAVLPGKIHIRADALALPADIPSSVPAPSGTRSVNINSPSDLANIGSWSTVRDLNVSPSNQVINVPPGNYGTFTANGGNIRFVFSPGTYNFAGTINLNNGSSVQSTGIVTINIGQGLNVNNGSYLLGNNTLSGDVRLNVVGSSLTVDNGSQINALVRAVNANVNINSGTVRGQLIANYLNINSGQIIGATCATDGTNCGHDITAPTITITNPANNLMTTAASVNVTGTAVDSGSPASGVASVTVNGSAASFDTHSGAYNFNNLALAIGSNTITVRAVDVAGNAATQTVTVTRNQPPDSTPPNIAIASPANNAIVSTAGITVSGTANDLGAGATGINRVTVNGQIAAYNAATGAWTINNVPLNEGSNTITAVAYDNALPTQNSSQTSIVVVRRTLDTQAPTLQVIVPQNNSQTYDSAITVSGTAVDEGINASGTRRVTVNGQPATYDAVTHQWSLANVALAVGANTITVVAEDNATPSNSSQVVVHVTRNEVPPPTISISTPANNSATSNTSISIAGIATANGPTSNRIVQVTVNGQPASYDAASGIWTLTNFALILGANTITAKAIDAAGKEAIAQIIVTRNQANQPPIVNAGADQTIEISNGVALSGTATDDGLPQGNSVTTAWSKVSGPGEVIFANANALVTTANFSAAGTYVLRLTASDGELVAGSNVIITVNSAVLNQAPIVNAGTDQTVVLPTFVSLNGTVSDDGLPVGSSVIKSWSKVSGPGTVNFANLNESETTVNFSELGTYTLRLTATDSQFSSSDEVVIIIANLPDLIVKKVDSSAVIFNAQTLEVSGTIGSDVQNLGTGDVRGSFVVTFFEDRNGNATFDAGVDNVLGAATYSNLNSNVTASVSAQLNGRLLFRGNLIYAFVDSSQFVRESDESNNYGSTLPNCSFTQPTRTFSPRLEWSWNSSPVFPDSLNVMMTPAVADLNADGVPDIVFGSTSSTGGAAVEIGVLRALRGDTGTELFTVTDPNLNINTASSVAVADIDRDGKPEIIACDSSGQRLMAFENDGTFKWRSPSLEPINWGAPAIADIDGDGTPEIVIGRQVLNNDGSIRWTGTEGMGSRIGGVSFVADLNLDGTQEIVAGNTAYTTTGQIQWKIQLPDGFNAVGNFDDDPYPEIVLVSQGSVWLLEHDGAIKWGPVLIPGGGFGGPPTVADFDNDGAVEIGVAGANRYVVFDTNGSILWSSVTQDASSNVTGSSVFDFDGDGSSEVIYRDEIKLRVYKGQDGTVLYETPISSCTWYEYPFVVDIDGDANAEIVVVANNNCGVGPQRGVFVYGDANDQWVNTRKIWNQYSYSITNVSDDATIPLRPVNNWLTYNNFRQNVLTSGCIFAKPDLTASYVRKTIVSGNINLTARIGNGGGVQVNPGVPVSFYFGNPASGGRLLRTVNTTTKLEPGQFEDVSIIVPPDASPNPLWVVADDLGNGTGIHEETDETNNAYNSGLFVNLNLPPVVNAGTDQRIPLSDAANLQGTVSDDGKPAGSSLTVSWSKISGPGNVTFSNPNQNATSATFSAEGDYVLRLTASDSQLTASDDVLISTVEKRPTGFVIESLQRTENQLVARVELRNLLENVVLTNKPVQLSVNGSSTNVVTDANGRAELSIPFSSGNDLDYLTAIFAGDAYYRASSNSFQLPPNRTAPPANTPSNKGTDFWLTFPSNYSDGADSQALLVTSEVNTSGTVTAPGCGVNQSFQVTANTVARVPIPRSCQLNDTDQIQNRGIHVTAQQPVVVYGMNERNFTSDAYLGLPVNTLGKEYFVLTYGNSNAFEPSTQFAVVATANNTIVTIKPSVTTGTHAAGVSYNITLNQGQTYLLRNTEVGVEKDLSGTLVTSSKPIAVFGSHKAVTIPSEAICCADHIVEQLPPVNTWGKRFVLIASETRTRGDFFRFLAANDNTVIYLNGTRETTINRGQFYEKLVKDPTEVIATQPILVAQYSTSSYFDTATYGADPMMMIVPPYSQFLNNYTVAAPDRFNNFVNLAVPTAINGQVKIDNNLIPASSFAPIGNSGFSSARVSVTVGTHNLYAPVPFGVFSYGFATDEGYGYPGGMSLIPSSTGLLSLTLSPETSAHSVNTQACLTANLKDQNNSPLVGQTVNFATSGANSAAGSRITDAAGQTEFCYTGTNEGTDTVTANVVTNVGNATATASIVWSLSNQAPIVNAGTDQVISLPNAAALNGTATDDGLPSNNLTITWSKISGAGAVTFANPNAVSTSASFTSPGSYVLRLTVSDGQLSASDEVIITVSSSAQNQAPIADAGADQTVALNANLVRNPSAEAELVNGKLQNWIEAEGNGWTRGDSNVNNSPQARLGSHLFRFTGNSASAELRQDIDVRAFAGGINAGTLAFAWKAYLRSSAEAVPDAGRIIFEYRDQTNQNVLGTLDSGAIASTEAWQLTEDIRVPPANTGWIRIRLITARNSGATTDVFFDALSLRAVGNIAAARLAGVTADDGLPSGSTLTSLWTKQTGAGNVAFSNPNTAQSAAIFNAAGAYTLRLTASDGALTANDEAIVTVNPANTAPVVNAGVDQTIQLPTAATLNSSVTDDGAPQGSVTAHWIKVSGEGAVVFNNPGALNTTVNFSRSGTYVLRLTADDGDLEASDEVTVTVGAAAVNQPPTVDAGANQTIRLPINSVILNGVAADDGLPVGSSLSINWSKRSGAGNVTFVNPNAANTTANFSAEGSYVLRLTVSDGQYTAFDEVAVVVNPAQPTNQPPTANAGADQTIGIAQQAVLEGALSDDGLPNGVVNAAWSKVSGPGNVSFSNQTQAETYASFTQTGTYVLRLTVSDGELTASDDVSVAVQQNNVQVPSVEILTPADGVSISSLTQVTGNVSDGNWKIEYALQTDDNPSNLEWTQLATGSGAVTNGTLATLDPSLMLNGTYAVRLISVNQVGQSSDTIAVVVEGNLKVGHFTVSFEDLNVPVAGIPISVVRTYDSRDKRKGDFGAGWTLGLKSVRVEKSGSLGLRWYQTVTNTFIPRYCVQATRPHIVTVTMPDGKVNKFEARLQRECQNAAPITTGNLIFVPQAGANGQLETVRSSEVLIGGSVPGPAEIFGYDSNGIFDATLFRYTDKNGTQFVVDQKGGLQSIKDTNNNTVTVSASGIVHSSGKSISFTRDAMNRITQITDPAGNVQTYTYDAAGDLREYKDREQNVTKYDYEPQLPHHLKTITDPLNRPAIRNEYDADGRLSKHIDALGNEIVYTHNLAARIEIVRDRLNHETRFEYDERGNVLKKVDARGGETTFTYDTRDNVLSETNALGKTTVYTYDANDNRTSVRDPLNHTTTFTYNSLGRVLTATDARGKTTTNTYDTAGNVLTGTDADGKVTTNTYNVFDGSPTSTKDALGNITRYEYYSGYLQRETDALGRVTSFTYDQNGNQKTQTRTRTNGQGQTESLTTQFEYDRMNRLTKTILPDNTFTKIEYNALGQQTASIDQMGRRSEMEYDDLSRLIKTIYPDGKFDESTYDAEGRRLTSKDRAGKVTSFAYDELGRLTKTTAPDSTFTETVYDVAGQVKTSTDALGNQTNYFYDDAGRRTSVKNALNETTEFVYDATGNQLSSTDARNNTITYEYDNLSRRTKTIFADSTFTQTSYDALGRRLAERDQAGKRTEFTYDKLGRLTKVKDALNQETVYGYDELGQQTVQTDANNHTTQFEYDKLGRRTKRTLPAGQIETYSYFADGALQSKTDFNGKTTAFAYDNLRRLISKTPDASFNQPQVSFTYNDLGQRATMTDAVGATNYLYDARNRLQSKQTPFGTLSYTYDAAGSLKTTRSGNANGLSVDYSYDALNRLKTVKDNRLPMGANVTNYNYDEAGNLQNYVYPNQITTSYNYNSLNRLTNLTVSNAITNLSSYAYTLGAAGNRTQVLENGNRTVAYTYDDLYRLTGETITNDPAGNNGQVGYVYDSVGNRQTRTSSLPQIPSQTFSYDANDRVSSDTFDNNGNTVAQNGNVYAFDFENKLTSLNNGQTTFVYDGDGNRVSKTSGGVTTNYLIDTNNHTGYAQVVEELQGGTVTKQFTYGHDLISQRTGANVSFYQYDGHGSVRQLTDQSGAVTDTYTYDAFGNLIARTGSTANDYLYAGEQFDANLGFYYLRARYMNPSNGRFQSMDSFEGKKNDPISLHKYIYANANPPNKIDTSGHESIGELSATLSINTTISSIPATQGAAILEAVIAQTEANALLDAVIAQTELQSVIAGSEASALAANELAAFFALASGLATSILSSSIDFSNEREEPILFGQRRVGPSFSTGEAVPAYQSGRTLESVAADLTSGILTSNNIVIFVFRDPRSGQLVSANTRGLTVLSKAGLKPSNVIEISPTPKLISRLKETSVLGDSLPSTRIAITPSIADTRVLEVVNIPE